jgi:GT2 family glycosyltransferase
LDISVIIPTRNRTRDLVNLLDSLRNQTRLPDELIVVDASDNDDTENMLEEQGNRLPFDVIYQRASPGSARQRNIGFGLSRGRYLFFFDDDVVLEPEYVRIIYDTFQEHGQGQLGGVTGRIANIKESPKAWERIFKRVFFLTDLGGGEIKLSGFPSLRIDETPGYVNFLSGCNMVYLREVFSQFLFDEALAGYSYMEDVDLSFRVGREYRLYYQPRARLSHYPTTYKTYDSRALRKMMIQHHRYLFKKNLHHDLIHTMSHWLSILGVFLYNILVERDVRAGLGIIDALRGHKNC